MRFGCRRPDAVVSQGISWSNAEMCPGFPSPQAALVIWGKVRYSSDVVRLRINGREILIARIKC